MNFPFFKKKTKEVNNYLGIFLKEKEGVGLVMKMDGNSIIVQEQEKFSYSNGWDNLIQDVDQLILKLEGRTKTHLTETIFFVYSHFIDEKTKEIKKQYILKIKDLVKNLDLNALGYIECYEAVVNHFEEKEDLPLTAVLIELDYSNITVFVYKRGKLTFSKTSQSSGNLIDDLLTSFSEIKGKFLLPSRIVLYNTKDLDDESTKLLTYHWSEELFIQLPRVEIIKEQDIIDGLIKVFVNQLNKKDIKVNIQPEASKQEVLGFVIGREIEEKTLSQEVTTSQPQQKLSNLPVVPILVKLKGFRSKLIKTSQKLEKKWMIALGFVFIILGIFLNEYFFHKADLTVYLPYQSINKSFDLSEGLNIETLTKTADFTASKNTTGVKEIGEKAVGTVTIHNFDDNIKTFSKGTILIAENLNFTLDQNINVASASVVTINGGIVKQPGKTNASVTAQNIGSQGNIAAGKQFTIDNLPTGIYFAINNSAFSKGSKKEVKTVSNQDMNDLKNQLSDKAKQQNLSQVAQNKNQDLKLIKQLTQTELTDVKYDKELGQEANSLQLQAKVNTILYYYRDKDLLDKVISSLKSDVNNGYSLQKEHLSYQVDKVEQKNKKTTLSVSVKGKAIKNVSSDEILSKVKGKSRDSVGKILKSNFAAQGFELNVQPKIPIIQDFSPIFSKNISLKISTL